MNSALKMVAPENTVADLESKAAEYESRAMAEPEPEATRLRQQTELSGLRIAALKRGAWIPGRNAIPLNRVSRTPPARRKRSKAPMRCIMGWVDASLQVTLSAGAKVTSRPNAGLPWFPSPS
jgi:hypothetical protein